MKPVIAIQMVARSILWSLVFSFEIVLSEVAKHIPPTYLYYVAQIVMAVILFLITLRLGESTLVRDMRELCFYDVVVQCIGLGIHFTTCPVSVYWALCYIILILKFVRLMWMCRSADGSVLVSWPVFGVLGLYAKAREHVTASHASPQQDEYAYAGIVVTIGIVSLIYVAGLMIGPFKPVMALVAVCLIAVFYKRIITYLEEQEENRIAAAEAIAVAKATVVLNAELTAKNAELSEANRQRDVMLADLASKNAELQQLNEERALMVADFATRNALLRDASHDLAHPLFWMQFCGQQQVQAQDHDTRLALSVQFLDAMAHFRGILNDTIHNAKITTKLEPLTIRAISANAVTIWLWDQYQLAFADIGVEFSLYKANQRILQADGTVVPDLDEERVALAFSVATDVKTFKRILANLIMNALRHTAQGHVLIALRKRSNATCWIEVRDTGSGIPGADGPDWAANFVNLAQNVRNGSMRSQDAASHGLGINNVKNLCATLGTTMQLYSKVGWGSIFRFVLPLADADLASGTMADDIAELAGRYPDLIQ
jgi:signal transduction histidine kinase